jgi:hypothetical protein
MMLIGGLFVLGVNLVQFLSPSVGGTASAALVVAILAFGVLALDVLAWICPCERVHAPLERVVGAVLVGAVGVLSISLVMAFFPAFGRVNAVATVVVVCATLFLVLQRRRVR